jgi:endonuclease G
MSRRTKVIIAILLLVGLAVLLCFIFRSPEEAPKKASKAQPVVEEVPIAGCAVEDAVSEALCDWLELPAAVAEAEGEYVVTHRAEMGGTLQRNYTIHYDPDMYAALWVAYPLCSDHMATGREEDWGYDPQIPEGEQTSVRSGYGASVPTVNYPKNFYARGHQLPNADRSGVPEMMAQTYYSTNMTPQIQNGFNGAIWAKLEEAVRSAVPEGDTLYVVTGAAFSRVGADDVVKTVVNKNDKKELPVPNYYWKALLKVKREAGVLVEAQTVGFWLPHDDLKGHSYADYAVSVDQIEEWTGLNLFPNLPDNLETQAESLSAWPSFQSY